MFIHETNLDIRAGNVSLVKCLYWTWLPHFSSAACLLRQRLTGQITACVSDSDWIVFVQHIRAASYALLIQ